MLGGKETLKVPADGIETVVRVRCRMTKLSAVVIVECRMMVMEFPIILELLRLAIVSEMIVVAGPCAIKGAAKRRKISVNRTSFMPCLPAANLQEKPTSWNSED